MLNILQDLVQNLPWRKPQGKSSSIVCYKVGCLKCWEPENAAPYNIKLEVCIILNI